jgi:hypothetical protein
MPYPLPGALLPTIESSRFTKFIFHKNGILGEIPRAEMIKKLQGEVAKWQAADSTTTAIPALHYIAVTAQGSPEETICTACACHSNKSTQFLNGQNLLMLWCFRYPSGAQYR